MSTSTKQSGRPKLIYERCYTNPMSNLVAKRCGRIIVRKATRRRVYIDPSGYDRAIAEVVDMGDGNGSGEDDDEDNGDEEVEDEESEE